MIPFCAPENKNTSLQLLFIYPYLNERARIENRKGEILLNEPPLVFIVSLTKAKENATFDFFSLIFKPLLFPGRISILKQLLFSFTNSFIIAHYPFFCKF